MAWLVKLLKTVFFHTVNSKFNIRLTNLLMKSNNPSSNDSYPVFKG